MPDGVVAALRERVRSHHEANWSDDAGSVKMIEALPKYLEQAECRVGTSNPRWDRFLVWLRDKESVDKADDAEQDHDGVGVFEAKSQFVEAMLGGEEPASTQSGNAAAPGASRAGLRAAPRSRPGRVAYRSVLLFFPEQTFGEDGATDWIGLFTWGFVTQAGGASILAVLGKTAGDGKPPRTGIRPDVGGWATESGSVLEDEGPIHCTRAARPARRRATRSPCWSGSRLPLADAALVNIPPRARDGVRRRGGVTQRCSGGSAPALRGRGAVLRTVAVTGSPQNDDPCRRSMSRLDSGGRSGGTRHSPGTAFAKPFGPRHAGIL